MMFMHRNNIIFTDRGYEEYIMRWSIGKSVLLVQSVSISAELKYSASGEVCALV